MTTNSKKTLVVVLGPTGSGKTDVSIELAKFYGTEIVSADSRQIYRGLPIGTAQPDTDQLKAVRHHLIASHDITESYSCGRYEAEALAIVEDLFIRHDVVIAVGGSGLYIDALCNGMDRMPDADTELRTRLMKRFESEGLASLAEELRRLDPEYYDTVDKHNPKRVIRALEVCLQTGGKFSAIRKGGIAQRTFGIVKIGINWPREELYARIDRRVDIMVEQGLEGEVLSVYPHRAFNSLRTVGYREFFDYFNGKTSREEAIELIKRNSRRYAKRQMTWFRRDTSTRWFSAGDTDAIKNYIDKFVR